MALHPGLLVKWVSFLNSLHWPIGDLDLGVGGVSYVELLIMYELWASERLSLEKAHPRYLRPGRPISVSAVPFGPGIDIWRSCRFIGAMMRSLCLLPSGWLHLDFVDWSNTWSRHGDYDRHISFKERPADCRQMRKSCPLLVLENERYPCAKRTLRAGSPMTYKCA